MANINFPSTAGGDAIVKQYTSINIKSGDNVSVDDTCKGLIIYCTGDCTINGSLTMSRKAGTANNSPVPSDGLRWTFYDPTQSDGPLTYPQVPVSSLGTAADTVAQLMTALPGPAGRVIQVTKTGAGGGDNVGSNAPTWGPNTGARSGVSGAPNNKTGGGGGGCGFTGGGNGGTGICWGGGGGAGGAAAGGSGGEGQDGGIAPGPTGPQVEGGNAGNAPEAGRVGGGGGAGNPAGEGGAGPDGVGTDGGTGGGGLLALFVGGDLTIGPTGGIFSDGGSGGNAGAPGGGSNAGGGGGAGGGAILIVYGGSFTNNGSITASGGTGGGGGPTPGPPSGGSGGPCPADNSSGNGGDGYVLTAPVPF